MRDARTLFADLRSAPALLLAVSGGPDSVALMWLMARWRRSTVRGPRLAVVTVDHGLRPESAREARDVKRLARALDLPHRTIRWTGDKPSAGLPAAARAARYHLLAQAARREGATHIVTAHTRDDQAETVLMRLLRGSGIAGLAGMVPVTPREGLLLARPLLDVAKSRLIATLRRAGIGYAEDPTNHDAAFTRARLRTLMPQLAAEGGDPRALARLAARLGRANASIEILVNGAEQYLRSRGQLQEADRPPGRRFGAEAFAVLPEEVRLRCLLRAIDRFGHEGPASLGQVEALLWVLDQAMAGIRGGRRAREPRLKQTLAGALITLSHSHLVVEPAPKRRTGPRAHRQR